jgi:putative tricarboxylic transport membrane protein
MKKGDIGFAVICLGLSIWLILEGLRWPYKAEFTPGPGFFAIWLGIILGMLSIALLIEARMRKESDKKAILPKREEFLRIGMIMLSMILFALAMNTIGFTASVFLWVLLVLFFLEDVSAAKSILCGLTFGFFVFLIFRYWLEINLPTGLFGI